MLLSESFDLSVSEMPLKTPNTADLSPPYSNVLPSALDSN